MTSAFIKERESHTLTYKGKCVGHYARFFHFYYLKKMLYFSQLPYMVGLPNLAKNRNTGHQLNLYFRYSTTIFVV